MEPANILLVVILCFLILYTITHINVITPPSPSPSPFPYPTPVGGCSGTIYGCCPDNVTAKHDTVGSNCSSYPPRPPNPYPPQPNPYPPQPNPNPYPVGGCSGTIYGCCPDNVTAKHDTVGSNCSSYPPRPPNPYPPQPNPYPPQPNPNPYPVGGCSGTIYGCCLDNITAKHDTVGSNCSSYPPPPPPPQPQPIPPPNNNTCPTSEQGGNCTDTEYSCDSLFHGKIYSNYTGCSKGSYCCITPQ